MVQIRTVAERKTRSPIILGADVSRNSDTATLVFAALAERSPTTIAELTRRLFERFRVRLTYQAVRKSVGKLAQAGVIERTGTGFQISKSWLLKVKSQVDGLLTRVDLIGARTQLPASFGPGEYASYQFQSLYDLDIFWGDFALEYCARTRPPKGTSYIGVSHFAWWMIFNLGRETKFWRSLKRIGLKPRLVLQSGVPLNLWASRIYRHAGAKAELRDLSSFDDTVAYNLLGNFVIQVQLSLEAARRIKRVYTKHRRIDDLDEVEIEALSHEQFDLRLTAFEDPALAASIRRAYRIAL